MEITLGHTYRWHATSEKWRFNMKYPHKKEELKPCKLAHKLKS